MIDDLFDDRITFYLTHRVDIERWASLRDETENAVSTWLGALGEQIVERARTLDGQPTVTSILRDTAWVLASAHQRRMEGAPSVAIGLGWHKERGQGEAYGGAFRPYVGLWAIDEAEQDLLKTRAEAAGLGGPGWGRSYHRWPAWRWVKPGEDWWLDPAAEGERLIGELVELWNTAAPLI